MSKTNIGLVDYCKRQYESNDTIYCLGTWGQRLTERVLNDKCNQYSWNANHRSRIAQGIGKKAFDCCGLIKGYLWDEQYNPSSDENEQGMYNNATRKGDMSSFPHTLGTLVFMSGHVGVYVGNDEVIECTPYNNTYKVIKTNLWNRGWTKWGYYERIEYNDVKPEPSPSPEPVSGIISDIQRWYNNNYGSRFGSIAVDNSFGPDSRRHFIKAVQYEMNIQYGSNLAIDGSFGPASKAVFIYLHEGCRGNITRICQAFLYVKDYNPNGFDGIYGPGMKECVRRYQSNHGLEVDGYLGKNTAYSLFN